jgi:hypothetical protein
MSVSISARFESNMVDVTTKTFATIHEALLCVEEFALNRK